MDDRDTLIPCQACDGHGSRLVEFPTGGYRQLACQWCDNGFTDKVTAAMFRRWLNLVRVNTK
jgi:hypothetical protein